MGHSTKLHTPTQTDGDTFTEDFSKIVSQKLTGCLARVVTGPLVLWGEWSMRWYGIPTLYCHLHILVPDDCLSNAYETLKKAGFTDEPTPLLPIQPGSSIDPNTRWDELGTVHRIAHPEFLLIGSIRPLCVLLQGYSAAGSTFYIPSSDDECLEVGQEDPRTFPQWAGISIPSLETLARSFLRSYFALLRKRNAARAALKEASPEVPLPPVPRTLSILQVWISYVKFYGYHPLGETAMRIGGSLAPGIDEEMATYWERGF